MDQVPMMIPYNEPHIFLCDLWPPNTLTADKMQVYKSLEASGLIKLKKVRVSEANGKTEVTFLSTIPQEFLRAEAQEALAKIKKQQGGGAL